MARVNPWLARRVIGFAHQGGAAEGAPSTIAAMKLARENGTAALEFDLHLTADKQVVLHHDPVIEDGGQRVTIADKSLAELRQVHPQLATLDEVLTAFPGVPMTVEIKVKEAAEQAARALAAEVGSRSLIVTAFAPSIVARVRQAAPELDIAPGWPTNLLFWLVSRLGGLAAPMGKKDAALQVALRIDQVKYLKAIPLLRRARVADRWLVKAAHKRNLAVHVWTLNDEETMRKALAAGADGIFTDRPSVLTATLDAAGVRWRGP